MFLFFFNGIKEELLELTTATIIIPYFPLYENLLLGFGFCLKNGLIFLIGT